MSTWTLRQVRLETSHGRRRGGSGVPGPGARGSGLIISIGLRGLVLFGFFWGGGDIEGRGLKA